MDFDINDDQTLLRDTTRKFLDDRKALASLRARIETDETVDRTEWRTGADLGWMSMLVPTEFGGGSVSSQPLVDLVVLAGELGRVLYPAPFVSTNVVADAVTRFGSDEQKQLLPGLADGSVLGAWCASADSTPGADHISVTAARTGTGYRLDGSSSLVAGATVADDALVTARTDDGNVVHFIVPTSTPGLSLRVVAGLDLTRRWCEMRFDGVEVEVASRLGSDHDGVHILERAAAIATVLQAGEAAGAVDYLVDQTVQYAKDRVQFGRSIGSFQAIKHRLADLHVAREAVRATAYYAALAVGDDLPDASEAVAVAGSYVGDTYAWICGEALQLHGGIGFTWEHDVHLFLRRAKVDQVTYGEPYWHRERLCRILGESERAAV